MRRIRSDHSALIVDLALCPFLQVPFVALSFLAAFSPRQWQDINQLKTSIG
jgi:hypothetical protein